MVAGTASAPVVADANSDSDTYADANSNTNADTDADSDTSADTSARSDTDSDAYSYAGTEATSWIQVRRRSCSIDRPEHWPRAGSYGIAREGPLRWQKPLTRSRMPAAATFRRTGTAGG